MKSPNTYRSLIIILPFLVNASSAQEPQALSSRPRPTVEAYRLLFDSVATSDGLRVTRIQPNSPTLDMQSAETRNLRGIMEIGDIVSAVNGRPVRTIPEYQAQLQVAASHNPLVEITLIDQSSRESHRWQVQARKVRVSADSPPGTDERKAHFLLAGLTDDANIGRAMDDTLHLWQQPIETLDTDHRGNIRILRASDCRAATIRAAVRSLQVADVDTVFCVYCGHGAFDPKLATPDDPSHGHHFQIRPSGDLMRKTLSDELLAKGARLTVLISDTCNVEARALPALSMAEEMRTMTVTSPSPFEQLLFNYRGFVDISGTDFGQFGFCQPGYGAWFSASAIPVLQQHADWRTAFEQIARVVDNDFQTRRQQYGVPQPHMNPRAFHLDVYQDEPRSDATPSPPPKQREVMYRVRRVIKSQ